MSKLNTNPTSGLISPEEKRYLRGLLIPQLLLALPLILLAIIIIIAIEAFRAIINFHYFWEVWAFLAAFAIVLIIRKLMQ